jgi:hypothetical protein
MILDGRSSTASTGTVTVTATAARIRSANSSRRSLLLQNNGTVDVFVGFSSTVTTSTGVLLAPDQNWFEEDYVGAVYALVASGTAPLIYAEVG